MSNMSVSSSPYANAQTTLNFLKPETDETNKNTSTSAEQSYLTGSSEYTPDLSEALAMTLEGLGLGPNDPVTFHQIIEYRDQLSEEFEEDVDADLEALGIEDAEFMLVTNDDGSVNVISDHADKAKIEEYFKDNPDKVDAFKQIQALTNLEEARKEQKIDMSATRQRVQLEGMTTWFASSGKTVNSIMDFNSSGESSFFSGINKVV